MCYFTHSYFRCICLIKNISCFEFKKTHNKETDIYSYSFLSVDSGILCILKFKNNQNNTRVFQN